MRYLVMGTFLFISVTVNGGEKLDSQDLTLDQVLIKVLEYNPELKVSDFETRAAISRIKAAQLSKPVMAGFEFENFAGSGNYKGSDVMTTTLSLSKVFELGSKAELRGTVAQSNADLMQNTQDARRLDILAEAVRSFIHVVVDQQRLSIAKEKLDITNRTFEIVNRRVKAGRSPVAEKRRVSIAVERARIELEHAEHELLTTRLKLVSMWGSLKPDFNLAQADLFKLDKPVSFEQLETLLQRNPDLIRFATSKRLAEASLHLAKAKRSANLEFSAGVRNFSETDDNAFVLSMRMPFGLNSRAAPYIEEQQLQLQKEPFDYEKQRIKLYTALFEVYQEIQHAYTAATALQNKIIPEARRALKDYERGYKAGRYSFLELTDAQQTLLDSQLEKIMIAASYHKYKIEIDRLTGARLINDSQPTGVN